MNIETEQQQKFAEEFLILVKDAPQKFKDKWDKQIRFIDDQMHQKKNPVFNAGAIDLLSVELRNKFEILRDKYFHKSL